jgi:ABC-type transport system substrate-binding protein
MRRTSRWRRVATLLIAVLAAVGASAFPASPAAAATTPTCVITATSPVGWSAACTNGDPAIPYRLVLLCWLGSGNPYIITNGQLFSTVWTPTTQPITGVRCPIGIATLGLIDVGSPPPPPSANLFCESGNSSIRCEVDPELTGSLSITWSYGGNHIAAWDNKTIISSACAPGHAVSVVITNSTATATASSGLCRTGPWP